MEEKLDQRFGTLLRVLTSAKSAYTKKYFDALASGVLEIHQVSHREAGLWLKGLMLPLEREVQLRREWLKQREEEIAKAAASGDIVATSTQGVDDEAQRLASQQEKLAEFRARLQKILPEDENWWARGEAA